MFAILNSCAEIKPVLFFLAILNLIILLHEMGHYFFARYYGFGVNCFSVGFGPKLLGFYDKNNTLWALRLIPLGGYVQFKESVEDKNIDGIVFDHALPYQKLLVAFAGPLFNFLTSFILLVAFFSFDKNADLKALIFLDKSLVERYERGDKTLFENSKLTQNEIDEIMRINAKYEKSGVLYKATDTMSLFFVLTLVKFYNMFKKSSVKDLKGLVGIYKAIKKDGVSVKNFIVKVIMMSVSIGFINLIPVPGLDGGHIAFSFIEMISRRRLDDRFLNALHIFFGFLLISLMLYLNVSEILCIWPFSLIFAG